MFRASSTLAAVLLAPVHAHARCHGYAKAIIVRRGDARAAVLAGVHVDRHSGSGSPSWAAPPAHHAILALLAVLLAAASAAPLDGAWPVTGYRTQIPSPLPAQLPVEVASSCAWP